MGPVTSGQSAAKQHRRLTNTIKESLRALNIQLSLLNHQVSAHLDLKDVDLNCVDLINRHGPLSPTAIARMTGLHPATMTGILDRLERAGWVTRERDPADRRAVVVRALRNRNADLFKLLEGMNSAMDQICADYTQSELELLADFLSRTTEAGRGAAADLAGR
jgi:DNA-binding MarR family transcriptional regulator